MEKNFKKQVDLVDSSNNINDKLLLISLYYEFDNYITSVLGDDEESKGYIHAIEKGFEFIIKCVSDRRINVNNSSFSAVELMDSYLSSLLKADAPENLKLCIVSFKNELYFLIKGMKYVKYIEKLDSLSLQEQSDTMFEFRKFINKISLTTMAYYEDNKSREINSWMLKNLGLKLNEYLEDCKAKNIPSNEIKDNLNKVLRETAKKYLLEQVKAGKLGIDGLKEEYRKYFSSFTDTEQKLWLIGVAYDISGCKNAFKGQETERVKEICETAGIDELEYLKTTYSMAIRIAFDRFEEGLKNIDSTSPEEEGYPRKFKFNDKQDKETK